MKRFKSYLVTTAGILMVGLAASLVSVVTVKAVDPTPIEIINPVPVPTAMPTHLGVAPEDFVMLVRGPGTLLSSRFRRMFPNGQPELDTFRVPAGKLLVVTDYEFSFTSGPTNTNVSFNLDVVNVSNPNLRYVAHRSAARSDSDGEGAAVASATTGFLVGEGAELIGTISATSTWGARVRGYITNAGIPPLAIHAFGRPGQRTASFQVTRAGEPVSGAEVNVLGDLDGSGTNQCLASGHTDENGTFVVSQTLPDTITVVATTPDGQTASKRITLR